jgi:hypothetical protein
MSFLMSVFVADDLKLFIRLRKADNFKWLQNKLLSLSEWSKAWQLIVSIKNCSVITLGNIVPIETLSLLINYLFLK